jgi:hypothetical protein
MKVFLETAEQPERCFLGYIVQKIHAASRNGFNFCTGDWAYGDALFRKQAMKACNALAFCNP